MYSTRSHYRISTKKGIDSEAVYIWSLLSSHPTLNFCSVERSLIWKSPNLSSFSFWLVLPKPTRLLISANLFIMSFKKTKERSK